MRTINVMDMKVKKIQGVADNMVYSDEAQRGRIATNYYGHELRCPYCGTVLRESEAYGFGMIKYYCSRCNRNIFDFEL